MTDDEAANGEVLRRDGRAVIRFGRHLPQTCAEVWAALSDPDRLARWWGEVTLDPRPGGRFDVRWNNLSPEGERFSMHAIITEFDPARVLETTGDVHGVLRWELTPEPSGTRLVFTSTLDLPEEFRTRALAGWHVHLMALGRVLAGGHTDLVGLPEWDVIHARYEAPGG